MLALGTPSYARLPLPLCLLLPLHTLNGKRIPLPLIRFSSTTRSYGYASSVTAAATVVDAITMVGVPFTTLASILPFILIGIGVDDMVSPSRPTVCTHTLTFLAGGISSTRVHVCLI